MTTLNDITVRALKMHKADGIRLIAQALKDEQEKARDEARVSRVQVIFEGAVRGRTPDGKHYLFRSRHGSRYAYTCYQLKDALCGVWG